jgi:hypothetical protein
MLGSLYPEISLKEWTDFLCAMRTDCWLSGITQSLSDDNLKHLWIVNSLTSDWVHFLIFCTLKDIIISNKKLLCSHNWNVPPTLKCLIIISDEPGSSIGRTGYSTRVFKWFALDPTEHSNGPLFNQLHNFPYFLTSCKEQPMLYRLRGNPVQTWRERRQMASWEQTSCCILFYYTILVRWKSLATEMLYRDCVIFF